MQYFEKEQLMKKISVTLVQLLVISIPLPIRISSLILVITLALFLIKAIKEKDFSLNFITSPLAILTISLFLISAIGLLYTSNLTQGLLDLERSAFLISLLFIVYYMRKLNIPVFKLIITFAIGCFAVIIYGLAYALIMLNDDQQNRVFELGHTYFSDIIIIHPIYMSVYFIFIFFFLMETIRQKRENLKPLFIIGIGVAIVSIVGILFFLRSQMSLVIFVMLLVIYTVIILKRRAWFVTFALFTVALLVFLLDSNRVTTFFDRYGKNVSSALDQRFSVWHGTIEAIKTAPFFGAGTGGEQELINEGYAKTGYQEGIDNSYNAHNQYLQFFVRNGIPEFLCFLALLFYSFRQSLKTTNYAFLMFNMIVTLIMLTESFLNVQRGIVFFFFFVFAFLYLPYESEKES